MNNDEAIVQLLTEIRDNQQRQLEANQKLHGDNIAHYNAALEKQRRRMSILGAVIGGLVGLLIYITMTR
jgi:hypothetical protein